MAQAKDLLKAISALTQAYGEDRKEHESTKKRLRRTEMKIRDLTAEIQYLADIDTFLTLPSFLASLIHYVDQRFA